MPPLLKRLWNNAMQNSLSKIHFTSAYLKAYSRLPKHIQAAQDTKEQMFLKNPFDLRFKTHKLKGKYKNFYSYSVAYQWRVLFRFIKKDEVIFYDIGTHEIYRSWFQCVGSRLYLEPRYLNFWFNLQNWTNAEELNQRREYRPLKRARFYLSASDSILTSKVRLASDIHAPHGVHGAHTSLRAIVLVALSTAYPYYETPHRSSRFFRHRRAQALTTLVAASPLRLCNMKLNEVGRRLASRPLCQLSNHGSALQGAGRLHPPPRARNPFLRTLTVLAQFQLLRFLASPFSKDYTTSLILKEDSTRVDWSTGSPRQAAYLSGHRSMEGLF